MSATSLLVGIAYVLMAAATAGGIVAYWEADEHQEYLLSGDQKFGAVMLGMVWPVAGPYFVAIAIGTTIGDRIHTKRKARRQEEIENERLLKQEGLA